MSKKMKYPRCRNALKPSMPGMAMSNRTMSGINPSSIILSASFRWAPL